ncbi:MAG TPA: cation-translocating P-type ATPase [Actinomycetaceae bacterium]|nr:cation-translocating P-type ATPase [Actinomycetaceae bacterium]
MTVVALERGDVVITSADQVAASMDVDPQVGLTAAEAQHRLEVHGPNELVSKPKEPVWKRLLRQFQDPLIYLLLVAIVISVFAWVAEGAHGAPVDAIVIAIIVIANAIIGFVQENKAADAVAALADMTATHSTVLRDGLLTDITSSQIVPGDVLMLSEGDAVGADGRIVTSSSLRIQEASLTGESESVQKHPSTMDEAAGIGDSLNMVFKGTGVTGGVGRVIITATGMDTEVGHIATLLDETETHDTPLQKEIAQISKTLGLLVIGIAIVVMATMAVINGVRSLSEAVEILLLGVSLAVAAVPEGLPAILSLVLAIGVQVMARQNAVMKDLHSVETLGSVSVICSDKTGTLTKNEMTLREIVTASGRVVLGGTGYEPVGDVDVEGDDVALDEAKLTIAGGSLANNAQLAEVNGTWQIQGDPTEAAFLVAERKLEGVHEEVGMHTRSSEVPFSSDRKMMSVLVDHPEREGLRVFSKGAPDVLLQRCVAEQVRDAVRPLDDARRDELNEDVVQLSRQGYRTLGVAWRESDSRDAEFNEESEEDLTFVGIVAIIDPPRTEAGEAIKAAHGAGIRTVMITGDHPVTAQRIASDLGISDDETPVVVTGRELEEMDDDTLREKARDATVYARVSPEHKLRIVDALQEDRQIVGMTGDGVNDAPALKAADIGIAMGITGTEVTKDAGKMILGDDNYATIMVAVRQGRIIFDNIKKFMRYLLSSNMGEVATVFLGVVLGGFIGLSDPANPVAPVVPLLATQILWINLVTDSGPALAMGVDPEIDNVMVRPPRNYDDRILDMAMWRRIIGIGLVMGILSLLVYDLTLPGGLVGGFETLAPVETQLDTARTTVFTALVFMQLFNALNSRSDRTSAFSHLFTNRWLWASFAFAVVTQILVVEVPFLQGAFGTIGLQLEHWALATGAGVVVLLFEEVVKVFRRASVANNSEKTGSTMQHS